VVSLIVSRLYTNESAHDQSSQQHYHKELWIHVRQLEHLRKYAIIADGFLFRSKQTLILATPAGIVEVFSVVICGYYSDKKVTLYATVLGATLIDEDRESACYQ
jgi:hypothetical protein